MHKIVKEILWLVVATVLGISLCYTFDYHIFSEESELTFSFYDSYFIIESFAQWLLIITAVIFISSLIKSLIEGFTSLVSLGMLILSGLTFIVLLTRLNGLFRSVLNGINDTFSTTTEDVKTQEQMVQVSTSITTAATIFQVILVLILPFATYKYLTHQKKVL